MLALEFAQWLNAQHLAVLSEVNPKANQIFIDDLPDTDGRIGIGIYHAPGYASDKRTALDRPSLEIVVRGTTNPAVAHDKAKSIYDALQAFKTRYFVAGGTEIISITAAQGGPVRLGKDGTGRFMYSLNFDLVTVNQARS
ncbi:MAG TPA: minor capsid protein [Armatimonadota bacterium]|jgi:hypothetical protein